MDIAIVVILILGVVSAVLYTVNKKDNTPTNTGGGGGYTGTNDGVVGERPRDNQK